MPNLKKEKQFVYGDNLSEAFGKLGILLYNPDEWQRFLDSSKRSIKCVLLNNKNRYESVLISHTSVFKK